MADHPLFSDDMREIVESFIAETRLLFDDLDRLLPELEQTPQNKELVNEVFRSVHTVKGTAGFLSLGQLSDLAHRFEDVLNRLRHEELTFQPYMMDVFYRALEAMRVLGDQVIEERIEPLNLSDLIANLDALAEGREPSAPYEPIVPPLPRTGDDEPEDVETAKAAASDALEPGESPESREGTADAPSEMLMNAANVQLEDPELNEMVESFVVESRAILAYLADAFSAAAAAAQDASHLNALLSNVRVLKGTASFLSLEQLGTLSHHLERALDSLRTAPERWNADVGTVFDRTLDTLSDLVNQVDGRHLTLLPLDPLVDALHAVAGDVLTDEQVAALAPPGAAADTAVTPEAAADPSAAADPGASDPDPAGETLHEAGGQAPPRTGHAPAGGAGSNGGDTRPEEIIPTGAYAPSPVMMKAANTQLAAGDMQAIIDSYLTDARELLDDIELDLPHLNDHPDDAELLEKILGALGSLKGMSGFLSLEQLSLLALYLERVIEGLIRGKIQWSSIVEDALQNAFGQLQNLIAQVETRSLIALDLSDTVRALIEAGGHRAVATGAAPVASPPPAEPPPGPREKPPAAAEPAAVPDLVIPGPDEIHTGADHPMYSDDMKDIVESFAVETAEIFERLDNQLLELEQNHHDKALVDEIFRAVHTVKGTSGFLSLEQLNFLTHHFEDVLNRLRRDDINFHPSMMDVMFEAFDLMKVLTDQVSNMKLEYVDTGPIIRTLAAISRGTFKPDSSASVRARSAAPARPKADDDDGDASSGSSRRSSDRSAETIRVEVGRLDSLMNLVGELVLGRNRLLQVIDEVGEALEEHDDLLRTLVDTSAQVDFITSELQTGVMHTRMVQMGRVFNKFPRVVRDLAKDFNKQINLIIEGAETELDKSLTEEIGDPLVHLIRNAADHGVETPEIRKKNGKDPEGTIRLSAGHEGNSIVIEIQDDGAGMDPEKLKRKAIEKQLITEKEATEMSDAEAYGLIFKPGFSTAEKVSKVSGRGVGMDVVKTNITRLNGTISIDSTLGKGSKFTLKLPLTLAINQSLLIRQSGETFAIPLHSVIEVVSLGDDRIDTINGREVIRLRERVLPLVRVDEALNLEVKEQRNARTYAVVVGLAHHRVGLVADDLVGQKEIVIKPLGSYLKKIPGIAGSTILGDGRVIMIIDVAELIRMETEKASTATNRRFATA